MKYEKMNMFIPSFGKEIEAFDALAFFDEDSNRIVAINTKDYLNSNFEKATAISKTAELAAFGSVRLVNPETFVKKFPSSQIESYIIADHSDKVRDDFDFYLAAYIILYRNYKSLETLAENRYISFIDSFIDYCVSENTDNPGTLCYHRKEIHKVFKLRKAVFEMFKSYFTSYSNYSYILRCQLEDKYTDKDFRKLRRLIKNHIKRQLEAQNERRDAKKAEAAVTSEDDGCAGARITA